MPEPPALSRHRWRIALIAVALAVLLVAVRFVPLREWASDLDSTIRSFGPWGPVALGLVYVVLTLLLVPGSVLTLAAGAIYGVAAGTAIVSVASTTSVALAFLLARFALRERVRGWMADSPRLAAIDEAIGREGWKIVALLRLSPAVPFGLQNYVYGVTSMRFGACVLASWLSMLPGTLMYAYLGSVGADALAPKDATAGVWLLRGAGLVATVAGTVYISRVAQRAVRSRIEKPPDQSGTQRPAAE